MRDAPRLIEAAGSPDTETHARAGTHVRTTVASRSARRNIIKGKSS
jgi:hypothetical protein